MKNKRKHNKWLTLVALVISAVAIYIAFDIRRSISYYNRGTALMTKGDYDGAIQCFDKAIKVEPEFSEAYCHRGLSYYEKGNQDRALADFDKAIELNPEFVEAYYNRAVVYYDKKEYDKAWDDVHEAQRLGHQIPGEFLDALRALSGKQG